VLGQWSPHPSASSKVIQLGVDPLDRVVIDRPFLADPPMSLFHRIAATSPTTATPLPELWRQLDVDPLAVTLDARDSPPRLSQPVVAKHRKPRDVDTRAQARHGFLHHHGQIVWFKERDLAGQLDAVNGRRDPDWRIQVRRKVVPKPTVYVTPRRPRRARSAACVR
jgi:hypothetical protein